MHTTGHGSTVITARAGIPLPMKTVSGRTIWDDIERAKKRRTGLEWPVESVVDTPREPAPKAARKPAPRKPRGKPGPRPGHGRPPLIKPEEIEQMKTLYEGGMGLLDVGAATGYSKTTVVKYLREAGVTIRPPARTLKARPNAGSRDDRTCEWCGSKYPLRENERPSDFRRRRTCSRKCSASLAHRSRNREKS